MEAIVETLTTPHIDRFIEAVAERAPCGWLETSTKDASRLKVRQLGHAICPCHVGELIQGPVRTPDGSIQVGLVTLLSRIYQAVAVFQPDSVGRLRVRPSIKTKALRAAKFLLEFIGHELSGEICINNFAPPCKGFGGSTMDVSAAMLAVLDYFGLTIQPQTLGKLAVEAEVASDPLFFSASPAIVWGSRCGEILEILPGSLPPALYVAFDAAKGQGGVDTVELAKWQQFNLEDVARFRLVLGRIRRAVREQDVWSMGEAATLSAVLNQKQVQIPGFSDLLALAHLVNACGISISHSGSLVAIILNPMSGHLADQLLSILTGLLGLGFERQTMYIFVEPLY